MFILYQTTCLVNGKKYIGVHNGTNANYLGSGDALKAAVGKYGKENFIRETLEEFDTEEEAYSREAEVVSEAIVLNERYYNINLGGHRPPNATGRKIENTSKYSEENLRRWGDPKYKERVSARMKESWVSTPEKLEHLRTVNKGRKLSKEHVSALREGHKKTHKVWTITDGVDTWEETTTEFSERFGVPRASVHQCVWKRGKYKHWRFS